MSGSADDWVLVGRFGRPHGLKGLVTVHSFTQPATNLVDYKSWHVLSDKQWQPLKDFRVSLRDNMILVAVAGIDDRDKAARLTNKDIAIARDQLPVLDAGEYYWDQLIGMDVVNEKGIALGVVVEMIETGSNDVLVVQGEKRYLIPYLPGLFLIEVDLAHKRLTVAWDEDF